jgi:hypothetical protein
VSNAAALAALASIKRAVNALSRVPSRVASDGAESIKALIAEQFATQTDPYGTPWAPHQPETLRRWGEHPVLNLTGALSAVDVAPMRGAGIAVTLGAPYGAFHQVGTRWMPARPILPVAGLPSAWSRALSDAADAAFERTMAEAQ